jgi:hypothetical protein
MTEHEEQRQTQPAEERAPEDLPDEPGAQGGSESPAVDKLPGVPAADDAPLGDTDQHSSEASE